MVALKGSVYLDQLIATNILISKPSKVLDDIYGLKARPALTRLDDVKPGKSEEELLIRQEQFSEIATEFKDSEISVLGKRAINQITKELDGDKQKASESVTEDSKTNVKVDEAGKQDQGKGQ